MRRKYLDDLHSELSNTYRSDLLCTDEPDKRRKKWRRQRKMYGFDERETWCMYATFIAWLYERLKMFVDVNITDLDFYKFTYKGNEYTQGQLIDMMIEKLEYLLTIDSENCVPYDESKLKEIAEIWGLVLPAMWW